ncbi:MAG: hypothetical protein GYB65_04275 [Chloroflexi bacterium]|nr:hypothetical protein [Chloroflexota bacterium]
MMPNKTPPDTKRGWLWGNRGVLIALVVMLVLAGVGGIPTAAQDDAETLERIRAAYDAYDGWDSFSVVGEQEALYAFSGQQGNAVFWQRNNLDVSFSGAYDRAESALSLSISNDTTRSSSNAAEETSDEYFALDLASAGEDVFWRGDYDGPARVEVADDWETARATSLGLEGYLLQTRTDPFVGLYTSWLEAVSEIDGPRTMVIDRNTTGRLYVLTLDPAGVQDDLQAAFVALSSGSEAYVDLDAGDLAVEDWTVTWGIILDLETDQLRGQYLEIEFERTYADGELGNFDQVTINLSDTRSVLFSDVNEPIRLPSDLPN